MVTLPRRKIYLFQANRKAHKAALPKDQVVHKVLAAHKAAERREAAAVEQRQQAAAVERQQAAAVERQQAAAVERQRVAAAVEVEAAIL